MHQAVGLFGPSESDWIVTLVLRDGTARTRRVSPGTVSEEHAVRCAVMSERVDLKGIDGWSIRRVGDKRVAAPDDAFAELLRRRMR
jgi:hypothetical protein